jgi:hypothetical protein
MFVMLKTVLVQDLVQQQHCLWQEVCKIHITKMLLFKIEIESIYPVP